MGSLGRPGRSRARPSRGAVRRPGFLWPRLPRSPRRGGGVEADRPVAVRGVPPVELRAEALVADVVCERLGVAASCGGCFVNRCHWRDWDEGILWYYGLQFWSF